MGQSNMRNTNQMMNLEPDQQAHFHRQPQPNTNNILAAANPMTGFVPHHQSGNSKNTFPYGIAQYNTLHNHLIAANPGLGLATSPNYFIPYATQPGSSVFPLQGPQFFDGFGGVFKKSTEGYNCNFQYGSSVAGSSSAGPSAMVARNPNHLIPVQAPWSAQQFSGNSGDGCTLAWVPVPAVPYNIQGSVVNNGISSNYQPQLTPMYPQSLHHMPQSVQGPYYLQGQSTLYGIPTNSAFQVGTEMDPGYVVPMSPGIAVHQPSQRRPTQRHDPHPNPVRADESAMREIPGDQEMENAVDNHRDMRMDVDSMSYEELLALEECIGIVTVGLTEETISHLLKTGIHTALLNSIELENQEADFCSVCQYNYEDQDEIGTLDCGHEYHANCIKKWLVVKNLCPICKSSALKADSIS